MNLRLKKISRGLLIWTAILLIWEGTFRLGLLSPLIFSSPSLVLKAGWTDGGAFADAFCTTAFEILVATAIAWSVGVAFGALAGSVRILARISSPLLSAMIALPFVIIYPVLTAWFGIGSESKIIFGVLLGLFPIALNTMVGVQAIEPNYFTMARSLGASRLQAMTQVLVPLALPSVVAGLRLGTSLVIVGVILTEMLASTAGLGFLITYHRALFDTGHVVLGIVLGLTMSFLANLVLSWIENRYGGWRALQQELVERYDQ
jgi:NitT/TauT family transport system permease protein/taurine transport system permease protein